MIRDTSKTGSTHRLLSLALGCVLLLAAFLEGHEILTRTRAAERASLSAVQVWFVPIELLLGLFLTSALSPRVARYVGIVTFASLGLVAAGMAFGGADSCGYFGRTRINLWFVVAFDLMASLVGNQTPAQYCLQSYICRSYAVEGATHGVSGSTGEGAAHGVSGFASPNRLLRARLLQLRNS